MCCIQNKIDGIDTDLKRKISPRLNDLKIATSIPGIEFTSAATILAEIGDYRNSQQRSSWLLISE
jgi:transposase